MNYNILKIEEEVAEIEANEGVFFGNNNQYDKFDFFHLDQEFRKFRLSYEGWINLIDYQNKYVNCYIDIDMINGNVLGYHFKKKETEYNYHLLYILNKCKTRIMSIRKQALYLKMSDMDKILDGLNDESNISEIFNLDIILEAKELDGTGFYTFNSKLGKVKMIQIKKHMRAILKCIYEGSGEIVLSSKMTFNGKTNIFNKNDLKILEYANQIIDYSYNYLINPEALGNFIEYVIAFGKSVTIINSKLLDGKITFNHVENSLDIELNIDKSNSNISILMDDFLPITSDYRYVIYNNNFYSLDSKQANLLKSIAKINSNGFKINADEIEKFNTLLLPKIRKISKTITVDDKLEDIIIIPKIKLKMMFDIFNDGVTCEIHNDEATLNKNILSSEYIIVDESLEKEAINILLMNGFILNELKNRLELTDEEKIFEFMEEKIKDIPDYFEIYITDSLKIIKYSKNTSVKSDFNIGKDGILKCKFEIEGISSDESENLMLAIKSKKRFHRLKNGDIIKLIDNDELEQLGHISDSLNISNKNVLNNNTIPAYKAIYLNELKEEEKLSYVNTNKEFNHLIETFNKYKDDVVEFDEFDLNKLRDYQKTGINFLTTIYNCGFGAILADEMGLGKTAQSIMFIKHLLKKDKNKNFLIVCPTSLIYNWKKEFNNFAPDIKVLTLGDSKYVRKQYFEKLEEYDVFITSYGMMRQDFDNHIDIEYDTIIIDEAQAIKNINSDTSKAINQLKSKCKIALTGTPMENSLMELFSLFNFIMPGFLGAKTSFNNRFTKQIIEGDKEVLKQFNSLTQPFILRRKKKNVMKDLPDKIETNLVYEMSEEQKKIYTIYLKESQREVEQLISEGNVLKSNFKLLTILTKLKQICIDPRLCIDGYNGPSVKTDAVIELITNTISENHKILLFSQYVKTFDLIKPILDKNNIKYYYIDGKVKSKDRHDLVEKFNENDIPLFLISLTAGGTGLNLHSADVVIHLDMWWNPAKEDQATDRAHRMGQKNVVEVIKPIVKDTIEEEILALQSKKRDLCEKIIDCEEADNLVISSLTVNEIKQLLSMN